MISKVLLLGAISTLTNAFPLVPHSRRRHDILIDQDASQSRMSNVLKAMEELVFGAEYCAISDPFPTGTTKDEAVGFLMKERDVFFSADGTRPVVDIQVTPELRQLWEEACDFFNYERKPTEDDIMIGVDSSIKFPGMKLVTKSANGIYIVKNSETGMDEYHVFFVGEQQRPEGLKPAVWIFNQLTGNANREIGRFYKPSGTANSVVSVVENDDGTLSFALKAKLSITVKFPSTLIKILPMSKAKMEENAGKSVQKAIAKDVDLSVTGAYKAFVRSLQTTAKVE